MCMNKIEIKLILNIKAIIVTSHVFNKKTTHPFEIDTVRDRKNNLRNLSENERKCEISQA